MATQDQTVPKWHADFLSEFGKFREENQKQHGELGWRIAGLFAIQTAALIAAIHYFG